MTKLFNGDAIEYMEKMIDKGIKVDAIITDPPYNIAKDNNFHTMRRQGIDFREWDKGFDLFSWIDYGVKLLTKDGSMVIFNDWKKYRGNSQICGVIGIELDEEYFNSAKKKRLLYKGLK